MDLFINERSLCEQFYDRAGFQEALTRFMKLVDRGRRGLQRRGGRMWRSERLGDARALQGEPLHRSLNHVAGRELYDNFRVVVYDRANPAPWEPERVHLTEDAYFWQSEQEADEDSGEGGDPTSQGERVTDTSMAELAARKLRDGDLQGCLLNVEGSPFDGRQSVDVVKARQHRIALSCACAEVEFDGWLRQVEGVAEYMPGATEPPRDEQTCLADRAIYEPTERFFDARRIYRHNVRKHLYYVDNLHAGAAAHLEVFDKHGRHLGKASLDGQIIPNTKVARKIPKM